MADWDDYYWLVITGSIVAFLMGCSVGANDVANSFATSVGSKSITLYQAVLIAVCCEFLGAMLLGGEVVKAIAGGIADVNAFAEEPEFLAYGMLCALVSAFLWISAACIYGFAVSTTHSIVGGILGFAFVFKGSSAVVWYQKAVVAHNHDQWVEGLKHSNYVVPYDEVPIRGLVPIVISWFSSPISCCCIAALHFMLVRFLVMRRKNSLRYSFYALPTVVFYCVFVNTFFVVYKGGKVGICTGGQNGASQSSKYSTTLCTRNAAQEPTVKVSAAAWIAAAVAGGITVLVIIFILPLIIHNSKILDSGVTVINGRIIVDQYLNATGSSYDSSTLKFAKAPKHSGIISPSMDQHYRNEGSLARGAIPPIDVNSSFVDVNPGKHRSTRESLLPSALEQYDNGIAPRVFSATPPLTGSKPISSGQQSDFGAGRSSGGHSADWGTAPTYGNGEVQMTEYGMLRPSESYSSRSNAAARGNYNSRSAPSNPGQAGAGPYAGSAMASANYNFNHGGPSSAPYSGGTSSAEFNPGRTSATFNAIPPGGNLGAEWNGARGSASYGRAANAPADYNAGMHGPSPAFANSYSAPHDNSAGQSFGGRSRPPADFAAPTASKYGNVNHIASAEYRVQDYNMSKPGGNFGNMPGDYNMSKTGGNFGSMPVDYNMSKTGGNFGNLPGDYNTSRSAAVFGNPAFVAADYGNRRSQDSNPASLPTPPRSMDTAALAAAVAASERPWYRQLYDGLTYGMRYDIHAAVADDPEVAELHENAEKFDARTELSFRPVQVFTSMCMSFAHGSNDVANSEGPLAAIVSVYKTRTVVTNINLPTWVLAIGACGIIVGLALYGYNIMRVLGTEMVMLSPSRGFSAELATAMVVSLGSLYGFPLSTTHCQTGSVIGIGLAEGGLRGVNWRLFGKQVLGWIATIFVTGTISAALFSQAAFAPSIIMARDITRYENMGIDLATQLIVNGMAVTYDRLKLDLGNASLAGGIVNATYTADFEAQYLQTARNTLDRHKRVLFQNITTEHGKKMLKRASYISSIFLTRFLSQAVRGYMDSSVLTFGSAFNNGTGWDQAAYRAQRGSDFANLP